VVDSHVTLITGGGSGIGAATARRLLGLGHRVTITGRDSSRLTRFVESAGSPAGLLTVVGDAADYAAVESAVQLTIERFGRLDNVVANAGRGTWDGLADGDPAAWREMVLTNVLGPVLLIRASLSALKQTRGRIVLIGSIAGVVFLAASIYGATKWAVTALAENTRLMVAGDGIGVTLIAPGLVDTNFWDPVGGAPPGLTLTAEQIADTIAWTIDQPAGVDVNTVVVRPLTFAG
jgi:NADP-dependent 3-hydroxy acid dehydrogenase YdfG